MLDNSHKLTFIALLFLITNAFSQNNSTEIKVLAFNIWSEGNIVENGYDAIVDEVARLSPEFVLFSEVRNADNTNFGKRISASLKERGLKYYSFKSNDAGFISKYPIIDSTTIYGGDGQQGVGSIRKLVSIVDGKRFAIYVAHLHYLNCAYYLPRGYSGNTWRRLWWPVSSVKRISKMNRASYRTESIMALIEDANKEVANGGNVILGGDFNEPSVQDWIEENKNLYAHNGVVYPWDVSVHLLDNGYIDTYREKYPSPIDYPGFTCPSANKSIENSRLTFAPKSDSRERIDYIFYKGQNYLKLKDVIIVGPNSCISFSKVVESTSKDKFIEPLGVWPSDHKAVLATFEIK